MSTDADEGAPSDDVAVDEDEGATEIGLEDATDDDDDRNEDVEVGDAVAPVEVGVDVVSAT